MSQGQGPVTYSEPAGGAGSSPNPNGARDGVTIEGGYVVWGNLDTDLADPAELLDNRRTQMQTFVWYAAFNNNQAWNWTLNDQSAGGGINTIPNVWRSTAESYWSAWQPSNYGVDYAPFGQGERWYSGYAVAAGVNLPTTARPNVVGQWWGYNSSYQAGRINALEAAFRFATESFYIIGVDPYFEFHTPEMTTTAGNIFRLDSTYVGRDTGMGFREIVNDDVSFYSALYPPSTGQFYLDLQYNGVGDVSSMRFLSENAGGVSYFELNNWTDFADGPGYFTWQSGFLFIESGVEISLISGNCSFTSSNHSNLAGPTVASASNLDTPIADAQFDIQSTVLGFRPPSMTTAERLALPAVLGNGGLVVYDNTLNKLYLWDGAGWEQVQSI